MPVTRLPRGTRWVNLNPCFYGMTGPRKMTSTRAGLGRELDTTARLPEPGRGTGLREDRVGVHACHAVLRGGHGR